MTQTPEITKPMLAIIDRYAVRDINLAQALAYLSDVGTPQWLLDCLVAIHEEKRLSPRVGE